MSISQKILSLLREKQMTKAQLSKAVGIPYTTLDSMLKRDSDSKRLASFYKIAAYLGVTVEELVFDRPQAPSPILSHGERELLSAWRTLDRRGRGAVESLLAFELSAHETREKRQSGTLRRIPVYDLPAAAGEALPLFGEEYSVIEQRDVPAAADFGIRISGNSMEPLIANGSIVWVQRREALNSGDVGIFLLNGESLCKRLHNAGKTCTLLSENKAYSPIRILASDDLRAVGKVLL